VIIGLGRGYYSTYWLLIFKLSWLSYSHKLVKLLSVCLSVCVCLDVNQGGTNCNHCTQRLVILCAQTH